MHKTWGYLAVQWEKRKKRKKEKNKLIKSLKKKLRDKRIQT